MFHTFFQGNMKNDVSNCKGLFIRTIKVTVLYRLKMGSMQPYVAVMLKKIKCAVHKNGDTDGTCKRTLKSTAI